MKTKLFPVALLLFITSSAFSQGFHVGIKGGATLGKMSGQSFKNEFTLGYHVGAFATIDFSKKFGIQPEVFLSQVNVDTANNFSQVFHPNQPVSKINLQYLTIPILLNYNVAKFLTLQLGPQYGIMLEKNKNLFQNGKDAFKSGNFSIAAGVQLNLLKFRVYGRFVGGLTDLNNVGSGDAWKTQSIQLGVGLSLF
ncbi:MAG: PorT family protein [Bacteroidota bacterium]|nr:PorT family protein [Bacteroidota bacterium]